MPTPADRAQKTDATTTQQPVTDTAATASPQNATNQAAAATLIQRMSSDSVPAPDPRNPRDPRQFATYEEWLAAFSRLPDFPTSDTTPAGIEAGDATGFRALGDGSS